MKISFVRQYSVGLAAGLTFFLGCARPSAEPDQPRSVVAPTSPPIALVAQTAPVVPAPTNAEPGQPAVTDTNAPAIIERIPPTANPENVALSTGLSEVVKLAQSGVGEDVILAYVEKYSGRFDVGADQILYLNDLGVSSTVITSMLKHDGSEAAAAPVPATPLPSAVQTQVVSNVPETQQVVEPPSAPVATTVAPPPTSTDAAYFYDSLSPYGSWLYLSGYGWCWQPTVAVSVNTWRPYSDRGRWYWSDAGWYWNSDYSWGWAAFHYGRWYCHPRSGWVWNPGRVWAPSWVSWRYSPGYCGWAPLPPEARFVSGVGFTYRSRHVGIGFDFGLSDFHYSFVHINNFCDYAPYRHFVPRSSVRNVYRNTTVVNNYIVGNNNTVINRGVGRETIARSNPNRIREVAVRDVSAQRISQGRMDRVERQGSQSVVFRPQLPATPPPIRSTQFASRQGGQVPTSVGRGPAAGNTAVRNNAAATQPATQGRAPTSPGRTAVGTTTETRRDAQAGAGSQVNPRVTPNVSDQRTVVRENTETRSQPRVQPQAQQQSRVNTPLFGDVPRSSAQSNVSVPRSAAPPVAATPRAQTPQAQPQQQQPRYVAPSAAPSGRVYSPSATPLPATPSVRSAAPTYSPRHSEQTPRAVAPSSPMPRSAGGGSVTAPARSTPAGGGGGGGRGGESGGGGRGGERGGR